MIKSWIICNLIPTILGQRNHLSLFLTLWNYLDGLDKYNYLAILLPFVAIKSPHISASQVMNNSDQMPYRRLIKGRINYAFNSEKSGETDVTSCFGNNFPRIKHVIGSQETIKRYCVYKPKLLILSEICPHKAGKLLSGGKRRWDKSLQCKSTKPHSLELRSSEQRLA